jgi:hypothetical protein
MPLSEHRSQQANDQKQEFWEEMTPILHKVFLSEANQISKTFPVPLSEYGKYMGRSFYSLNDKVTCSKENLILNDTFTILGCENYVNE